MKVSDLLFNDWNPKDNEKDLADIDPIVRNALNFVAVETAEDVLNVALNHPKELDPTIIKDIPADARRTARKNYIQQ